VVHFCVTQRTGHRSFNDTPVLTPDQQAIKKAKTGHKHVKRNTKRNTIRDVCHRATSDRHTSEMREVDELLLLHTISLRVSFELFADLPYSRHIFKR
jgi:hypothetical protein